MSKIQPSRNQFLFDNKTRRVSEDRTTTLFMVFYNVISDSKNRFIVNMQKAPEQKNSISSSVYGIQQLLRDFDKQCHFTKVPEAQEIHALGVVNLDKVRHQFLQYINDIRSTCSQFETEVLGDVVKMGAGADPAFRKHLTHLKEQAQLESTVMRVKNILHDTKCAVENALNERETSKSKVQTRKLEKLAQSMGLMVFVDASQRNDAGMPITTITLGGTVIVVDIDIDEAGTVLKCKVTYVSEELQEDQDDRVDQLLARNLHAQDYDLFKRNLEALALLDQLNVKHTPTDFFLITRGLLADLKSIFNQELLLLSNDIASILMEGHGVPNQHLDYPGISISYWINKELVLGNDWNEALESITRGENHPSFSLASKVLISFEDSQKPNYFIPPVRKNYLLDFDESQSSIKEGEQGNHLEVVAEPSCPAFMQPMRFVKMLSSYPNISPVPVRFVAKLDPPIPAADSIIRKLMVITGTLSEVPNVVEQSTPSITTCLENMLIHSGTLDPDITWNVSFEDSAAQIYRWRGPSVTSGKLVHRVPFNHPSQLYPILQLLRQQQMFNTLFQSIFNDKSVMAVRETRSAFSLDRIIEECRADTRLHVDVANVDTPAMIHLTISLPPSAQSGRFIILPLSIEISRETPARPTVKLNPPSAGERDPLNRLVWNPDIFDQDKLTRVLQTGYNITLLVRWLWNRIERNPNVDYMIQTSRLHKRQSRIDEMNSNHEKRRRL